MNNKIPVSGNGPDRKTEIREDNNNPDILVDTCKGKVDTLMSLEFEIIIKLTELEEDKYYWLYNKEFRLLVPGHYQGGSMTQGGGIYTGNNILGAFDVYGPSIPMSDEIIEKRTELEEDKYYWLKSKQIDCPVVLGCYKGRTMKQGKYLYEFDNIRECFDVYGPPIPMPNIPGEENM